MRLKAETMNQKMKKQEILEMEQRVEIEQEAGVERLDDMGEDWCGGRGDGSRGDGGSGYLSPIEVVRKGVQQLELLRVSRLRTRRW